MTDLIFVKTQIIINEKDLVVEKRTAEDGKEYIFVNKIDAGVEVCAPIESVEVVGDGIVFKNIPESWCNQLSKFSNKP